MLLNKFTPVIISLSLCILFSCLINYFNAAHNSFWWISLLFFSFIFCTIQYLFHLKSDSVSAGDVLTATIWIKMLLVLSFIFVYSILDKKGLFAFSIHFILHYILFTLFEIRYLQGKIKNESGKG